MKTAKTKTPMARAARIGLLVAVLATLVAMPASAATDATCVSGPSIVPDQHGQLHPIAYACVGDTGGRSSVCAVSGPGPSYTCVSTPPLSGPGCVYGPSIVPDQHGGLHSVGYVCVDVGDPSARACVVSGPGPAYICAGV